MALEILRGSGRPENGYRVDGKKVPSVTTILGRYKDMSGLMVWACKLAVKTGNPFECNKVRDAAGASGSEVHDYAEDIIFDNHPEMEMLSDDVRRGVESFYGYLEDCGHSIQFLGVELPLISARMRCAGTPDAWAKRDGKIILLDWKTSKSIHMDYLIQMGAYILLLEENKVVDEEIQEVEIVRLCKATGVYERCGPYTRAEMVPFMDHFEDMTRMYHREKILKKTFKKGKDRHVQESS